VRTAWPCAACAHHPTLHISDIAIVLISNPYLDKLVYGWVKFFLQKVPSA
jgi:hypothetical protein